MGQAQGVRKWGGWTFPASETHLIDWMSRVADVRDGRHTYQANKFDIAMQHVKSFGLAVDIGANIGLWSWLMAKRFDVVEAFEPVGAYADCWVVNMQAVRHAHLNRLALGAEPGRAKMVAMTPGSCGDTTICHGQAGVEVAGDVEVRTLDSFGFVGVDFVKVDAEGFELWIMRGGEQTLLRCRPTVVVEQKPGHGRAFGIDDKAAVDYLEGLGMKVSAELSGDYFMTWRE